MQLILAKKEDIIFARRVVSIAHQFKTMKSLANHFKISTFKLKYRLGKGRGIDEVKEIIARRKTDYSEIIR